MGREQLSVHVSLSQAVGHRKRAVICTCHRQLVRGREQAVIYTYVTGSYLYICHRWLVKGKTPKRTSVSYLYMSEVAGKGKRTSVRYLYFPWLASERENDGSQ